MLHIIVVFFLCEDDSGGDRDEVAEFCDGTITEGSGSETSGSEGGTVKIR